MKEFSDVLCLFPYAGSLGFFALLYIGILHSNRRKKNMKDLKKRNTVL